MPLPLSAADAITSSIAFHVLAAHYARGGQQMPNSYAAEHAAQLLRSMLVIVEEMPTRPNE